MNRKVFFDSVRHDFGALSQAQVQGFEILLTAIDGLPVEHQAYLLATAWHETARTMQPVREALAKTDDGAIAALDKAWKAGKLKWVKAPYWCKDRDGKAWFGRGYVQLTHKANYQKAGDKLGVDLVADPSAAMSPMIAARILVQGSVEGWFTGKKLADFNSYREMRKVINGTDRAAEIAGHAIKLEMALKAAATAPSPVSAPKTPAKPTSPSTGGIWAVLARIIASLFAKMASRPPKR